MYQTYRFKHPAITLERNVYDQFLNGSVFFSIFLYLFSFYFIYQTTEILKAYRNSNSEGYSSSERGLNPPKVETGQGVVPPYILEPLPSYPTPAPSPVQNGPYQPKEEITPVQGTPSQTQIVPPTAVPFDIPKAIQSASHPVKELEPVANPAGEIPRFSYRVTDSGYEVLFASGQILILPKNGIQGENGIELETARLQKGTESILASGLSKIEKPDVKENSVTYQRSDEVKENYESRSDGLEQSWIFEKPFAVQNSEDLVISQKVTTKLIPRYGREGEIDFYDHQGNYITTYGKGTLKDADGVSIEISPAIKEGADKGFFEIELKMPADWLANAAFPVTLDPLIGNKLRVDTLTGGDYKVTAAYDGTNYMLVWMNGAVPGTGTTGASNIQGAVVSPSGSVVVTAFAIDNTPNDQMFPSVAFNAGRNNFLVVYQNYVSGTVLNNIFGRVVSYAATTATVQTPGVAIAAATGAINEQYPAVATDGTITANNNYVTYASTSGTLTTINVIPVTTAATTFTVGTAVTMATATSTTAPSVLPNITYGTNGTFIRYFVTWENFSAAGTTGNIYGNMITKGAAAPGLAATTPLGIAVVSGTAERYPSAAFDGTNFLVGYQSGATGTINIMGQFVTAAAAPALTNGAAFTVSSATGDQTEPSLAYNASQGAYLFAWTDSRNGTTDIYGARVTPAGAILDASGVNISNVGTSGKMNPFVVSGGANYYVAWRDLVTSPGNIYGQLVGPPQVLSLTTSPVDARSPLTINSTLYGTFGTFGPDPGSANRSTLLNNVTWGTNFTTQGLLNGDVTTWSLSAGINSSIGIIAPYYTALAGGAGPLMVTSSGWSSTPNPTLTIRDFSLSNTLNTTTVTRGTTALATVTLTPLNSFTTSVNLSMDASGPCPAGATCTFLPAAISSVTPSSSLSIVTTGAA
ncbi:MAG: hypothetical protein HY200_06775, partial [Nitrospirae bacterium]|nr:hypothetical protein [Nitrospirota bacterium]